LARDKDTVARELLAVRCRRGDRAALEELVRAYEGRLFYFVRRLVREETDAWDVLQKTWVRVLTGIGALDDPGRLVPWLYRIARNTALTHVRFNEPAAELPADVPDPGAADPADFEDADAVHHGLLKLSLQHREVLTLFFLEDMSVDEIADVLNLPHGTVKSRLYYAKHALRKVIDT
jgi:RNA polymerase sigma-70 factor (ECF subfamily)